jgi:hypothetical protein
MILAVLRYVGIAATVIVGLAALARPTAVIEFTGLQPVGGHGITEIRAVLGGLFVGLGAAALFLRTTASCRTLGVGYLATGVMRAKTRATPGAGGSGGDLEVAQLFQGVPAAGDPAVGDLDPVAGSPGQPLPGEAHCR